MSGKNGERMSGKCVLVTGAGSGIGAATATLFAGEGARLFLAGRTESKLADVAQLIRQAGSRHWAFNASESSK